MGNMIGFELRKLIGRKVTLFSTIGILICTILFFGILPFLQAWAFSIDENDTISGAAAVQVNRENAYALEGPLSEEKATEAIATYNKLYEKDVIYANESHEESSIAFEGDDFVSFLYSHNNYLDLISGAYNQGYEPFTDVIKRIDYSGGINFYQSVDERVQRTLDNGLDGTRTYTEAERAYWTDKAAEVETPYEYGWAGGWQQFLDSSTFLFLIALGIAIALAPLFTAEYQQKTDSIILSTRYGKSKLVRAKIIAAFIFTTVVFLANAAAALLMPLLLFGPEGGNLPVQLSGVWLPYALTYAQTSFLLIGLGYIATLGVAALTMLLSSFMKSTLPILIIAVLVVFMPFFIPGSLSGALNSVLYLFPINAVDFTTVMSYMSYQFGSVIVSLPTMIVIAYVVLIVIFGFLAARTFKRHQVK